MTVKKLPDSFAILEFGYSTKYVMPYTEGVQVMAAFANAEKYDSSDYENHKIVPMDESPTLSILSKDKYKELLLRALTSEPPTK